METLTLADFGSMASILSLIVGLLFGSSICFIKNRIKGNNNTINSDINANDFVGRDKK